MLNIKFHQNQTIFQPFFGYEQQTMHCTDQKEREKILKQVEYESARRKRNINEKQEKEMRKALHFFMYIYLFFILQKMAAKS